MYKVILFGAGNYARECWKRKEENSEIFCDDYLAFCDNNEYLWGTGFGGKRIAAPRDIKLYGVDLIVITSTYIDPIHRQLVQELGVPEDKIYTFREYEQKCYSRWVYKKRYGSCELRKRKRAEERKIVVYTTITGNYDELKEPAFIDKDITYVCFTNTHSLQSNTWEIEYVHNAEMRDIMLARSIKLQPHKYFPEFETSVWVDGKFKINRDLREYVNRYQISSPILCFPHFERECIYEEGRECLRVKKGKKEEIIQQISNYYEEGYPFDNGLYETGCLVRNHKDDLCKKMMDEWMLQIKRYSIRDQISLPYVFWKNDFKPDICDLGINKNEWLNVYSHSG